MVLSKMPSENIVENEGNAGNQHCLLFHTHTHTHTHRDKEKKNTLQVNEKHCVNGHFLLSDNLQKWLPCRVFKTWDLMIQRELFR